MLVLMRKQGQKIIIGNNIKVEVLRVIGRQVKLGIKAPKDILVNREELQFLNHKKPGGK